MGPSANEGILGVSRCSHLASHANDSRGTAILRAVCTQCPANGAAHEQTKVPPSHPRRGTNHRMQSSALVSPLL